MIDLYYFVSMTDRSGKEMQKICKRYGISQNYFMTSSILFISF